MNCNLLENTSGQFLTGFYAKSSKRRQHFEKRKKKKEKRKKKKGKSANLRPSLPFYGMIKSQHLCKGMAWLPFQKLEIN